MISRFVLRRLASLIPTVFGIVLVVFFLGRALPGDPALTLAGPEATRNQVELIRQRWGLDEPLTVQMVSYMRNLAMGDLGVSMQTGRPVLEEIANRLPNSLKLTLAAMVFAVVGGTLAGVLAAQRPYSVWDGFTMVASLVFLSIPVFWLSIVLVLIFSVRLGWLPVIGMESWKNFILPSIAMATGSLGMIARITRTSMLEVLGEDFVRTARAKGLAERTVIYKHALKNAVIPIITVIGLQFGILLGGSVLTETIFSWPGIGKFLFDAILARDYAVLQGGILVYAVCISLLNLLVDVSYALIDPRIRYS
ncbi:ABC transporter permease [Geochorda subterranea]|uniref:ABC transporter permease n=1 Tax=Geochorda subterranea TaxID=3109564 RepID=A0ABZ1BSX1_9FIRM|nr:ABC transporter permease [Limnochorda sp. LNt]WRP15247.1 ABC transporter permease [Limnochorda sp. LNt]